MSNGARSLAGVLIVDDEPQVITALTDLLEDDYNVFGRSSPSLALSFLQDRPDVSLIISDQRMPEMPGHEFLARARSVSSATRMLMTGYSDLKAVVEAINNGRIFGFISKPWEPAYLRVMVQNAIEYFEITRELSQERALLRNLMDSLPDEIAFVDRLHRYTRVNRIKALSLGVSDPVEAIGKSIASLSGPGRDAAEKRENDEIFRTRSPVVDKVERIDKSGEPEQWLSTTKAPIVGESDLVVGLVSVARDITSRYRAQEALLEQERRFRLLYNKTPVMLQSTDREGRLSSISDHWCEALGYRREEVLGRQSTDFMTAEARKHFEEVVLPRCRESGQIRDVPCQLVRKDGRIMDVLVSATMELDAQGSMIQSHAVCVDVTEKLTLQRQLLQSQKLEAIGQLTGGMAHDFNNLLGVVIGNLDILRERLQLDADAESLVAAATDAGIRGADLTRRLLAFARQQPLAPQSVQLNELVAGIIKLLGRMLGENIEISLNLAPDVWTVVVDPAQLEASLANLATNARDAMPHGGHLVFSTGNRPLDAAYVDQLLDVTPGDYAMIEVKDSGEGMPPDIMPRIFEPFFTTKEQGKGTGLGLSMVFGFIKQSSGHITVESEVGVGTTFRLYLPRADSGKKAEQAPATGDVVGGREMVLVVEDNEALRRVVVQQLESLGYRVLQAETAAAATNLLASEHVDLLFTDIVMPGATNGVELARTAVARWPSLKVILTTGFSDTTIQDPRAFIGGVQILNKPYRKADLARVLREALNKDVRAST